MQTRQRQTMSEVTVQHTLAEWRNRTQVGEPFSRTVTSRTCNGVFICHLLQPVLRHQLSPCVNQTSPHKPEKWMDCEPHLAARHLSRNAQERPCHSQEGHTGGTTPALQPQEHRVHNTSVALKAAARAQPPSSLISIVVEVKVTSATYSSREDRTYVPRSCVEHTSDRRRQPCECDDAGCKADRTPTFHTVFCWSRTVWPEKKNVQKL